MQRLFLPTFFLLLSVFSSIGQCDLSELRFIHTDCTPNGVFSVSIDFDYVNQGDKGFRVQGNGKNYGEYSYSDLPIVINALPGDCVTPYEFVIRDIEFPDCSIHKDLGKVCCEDCSISITDAKFSDCIDGGFDVSLNVEKVGTGNLGADIFFNGEAIEFVNYNDFPVKLTNLTGLNDVDNVIVVCDNDNLDCCDTLVFESPCQCKIFNTRYRIIECNEQDSSYYLRVNFDHQLVSDTFQIGYSSQFFGNFAYNDLPINIGPIPFQEDTINFLILDQRNNFCFGEILVPPFDECDTQCNIESVNAHIVQDHLCKDGSFYVELTVKAKNPGVKGFDVVGNGRVYADNLLYGKDSYIIGPLQGDCETLYEFEVRDNELPDCRLATSLEEPVCCENCKLSDLVVEPVCFEGNLVGADVDFSYVDNQDDTFKLFFGDSLVGEFAYESLPITVFGTFQHTKFLAKVIDNGDPDCMTRTETNLKCETPDCPDYFDFVFEYGECLEDGSVYLDFEFKKEGVTSDSFFVSFFDQDFGPFPYGETFYSIGPFFHACEFGEFTITDQVRRDCGQKKLVEKKACCNDCSFGDIFIEVDCDGELLKGIKVKAFNTGDNFTDYYVKIGDKRYGPFSYGEFHLIELSLANGVYEIIFVDREFEDCGAVEGFEVDCMQTTNCQFDDLIVETINCTEDKFQFIIDFKHSQALNDLFELYINGQFVGTSSYSLLPLTTTTLSRNDGGPWKILVKDREHPDCAEDLVIDEELCESSSTDPLESITLISSGTNIGLDFHQYKNTRVHISVFSAVGVNVYSEYWNPISDWRMDAEGMSSGIYFIKLNIMDKTSVFKVFVP